MKFISENAHLIFISAVVVNMVFSLSIAWKLYVGAPERDEMSFGKYWNALLLDISSYNEKPLLIYEDKKQRKELFSSLRIASYTTIAVAVCAFLVRVI